MHISWGYSWCIHWLLIMQCFVYMWIWYPRSCALWLSMHISCFAGFRKQEISNRNEWNESCTLNSYLWPGPKWQWCPNLWSNASFLKKDGREFYLRAPEAKYLPEFTSKIKTCWVDRGVAQTSLNWFLRMGWEGCQGWVGWVGGNNVLLHLHT